MDSKNSHAGFRHLSLSKPKVYKNSRKSFPCFCNLPPPQIKFQVLLNWIEKGMKKGTSEQKKYSAVKCRLYRNRQLPDSSSHPPGNAGERKLCSKRPPLNGTNEAAAAESFLRSDLKEKPRM